MFKCRNILPEICKLNANLYRRYFKHHVCYHNSNSLQILFKLNSDSEFKLGFKRYIYIFFYLALKMTSPWSHQQMFMTVVLLFNWTEIPVKTLLLTLCTTALQLLCCYLNVFCLQFFSFFCVCVYNCYVVSTFISTGHVSIIRMMIVINHHVRNKTAL